MRRFWLAAALALGPRLAAAGPIEPVPRIGAPVAPAAASIAGAVGNASPSLAAPTISPLAAAAPAILPVAAPAAPLPAAAATAVTPAQAEAPVRADLGERQALVAEVWRALEGLPRSAGLAAFAKANGLRLVAVPFSAQDLLGLDGDNIAQMEFEDRLVYLNWELIAPDLAALLRKGLSAEEARRAVALLVAPTAAHELLHAKLRLWHGRDFPGTREEEILTHVEQAALFEDVLRGSPWLSRLDAFLTRHQRKAWEAWREGFGPAARFVLRKYDGFPSLNEPAKNAKAARKLLARFRAEGGVPPVWLSRLERAIALWDDPGAVAKLVEFLQARIDETAASLPRR